MITIRTKDLDTLKEARNILIRRRADLSDDEFETLVDLEYVIARILTTNDRQIKNALYCRRYREKRKKQFSEYNHKYYIDNVKQKRKEHYGN